MTEADSLERGTGECATLPERHAGVEHSVGDVVERGHRVLQVESLEDEADLVGPQSGELTVRGLVTVSCPATRTRPALGRSSVPRIVSIVVLPEPDGPTTAT